MAKIKSKDPLKYLVQVTEKNRQFALKLGRKIHIVGANMTALSPDIYTFIITPRPQKNTYWCVPEGKTWVKEEQSRSEYAQFYSDIFDKYIPLGKVFINLEESIVDVRIEDKNFKVIQQSEVKRKEEKKPDTSVQTGFQ